MVQEYERAVIFRLGRLLAGGAKGPGKLIDTRIKKINNILNIHKFAVLFLQLLNTDID